MKRIFALILSFALLLSCLVLPAGAMFDPSPVYQVQAQSAYIVNTDTNIIVYEKDSTKQVSAGGLTKYMTIALVLTNYADQLDNTFQMPFAISDYVHNTSNADMRSNETFTYPQRQRSCHGPCLYPVGRGSGRLGEPDERPVSAHRYHEQHLDGRLRHRQRQRDMRCGHVPDPALPDEL